MPTQLEIIGDREETFLYQEMNTTTGTYTVQAIQVHYQTVMKEVRVN